MDVYAVGHHAHCKRHPHTVCLEHQIHQTPNTQGADLNTAADTTIDRVATLVDYLLQQEPTMHVVLQGLLPRGFRSTDTHDIVFDQPSMYV